VSDPDVLDCAIVGGGVGGMYAAWRLSAAAAAAGLGASGASGIRVFEMTRRVGGRLYTVPVDGMTAHVELGAMRFWSGQLMLSGLIAKFGIPIEPFPSEDLRSAYLRGMYLSPDDFGRGNIPFRLSGDESRKNPGELLAYALEKLVPGVLSMTEPELSQMKSSVIPLGEVGFWNALQRVLSNEAYQLLFTGSGIASVFSNWSATEGMKLMARIINALTRGGGLHRPARGWSEVPDQLHHAYVALGGQVSFQRRLVAIEYLSGPRHFRLGFAGTDEWGSDAVVEWVESRKVILALPQHALQLLVRGSSLLATPRARYLLQSVDAIDAFRMYFIYDRPWWTAWGDHGYSVTDQPISQVFYGMGLNGTDADEKRVLMASYADSFHWPFWAPLVEYSPALWARLVEHHRNRTPLDETNPPPEDLPLAVDQVLYQVSQVHGLTAPKPLQTIHKDWGAVGGAWHAWRAGVPVGEFGPMVRHPAGDLPIVICGEAYSGMQGWVEGALTSTERTLQSPPFNLAWPDWLDRSYDIGP
jgi:monoamine oxidase